MASDNDWYSDESDEAFYEKREGEMWEEMRELNEDIIDMWDFIKQKTIEVKKMEEKYRDMKEHWEAYCEVRANDCCL